MTAQLPTRAAALAGACTALIALAACSTGGSARSTTTSHTPVVIGGTARIALPYEIPSFNPYTSYGLQVASYAYDSLVNITDKGEIVSGLASKWQATATSATFTVRSGVTCSDGTTLTAADVAASITYASDPKNQLVGVSGLLPGVPFTATADASANTVSVKLSAPFSFILRTIGVLPIVCPGGLRNPKSLDTKTDGTGPYTLSSYTSGGPYTLTVRKGYAWGPGGATTSSPGQPAKIVLSVVSSESTAANLLLTGGLDIATVSGPDRARLAGPGFSTASYPEVLGFTEFNESSGHPLSDPAVRKALVEDINRQALANVAAGGQGTPGTGLTSVNAVCHTNLAADLPKGDAAAALAADGWTKVGGKLEKAGHQLSIRVVTSSASGATLPSVAEELESEWEGLGINVTVANEDLNGLTTTLVQTGNWDVTLGSVPITLPSQLTPSVSGMAPPKGANYADIQNVGYTNAETQALTKADTASCADWNKADAALLQAADLVPIADGSSYTIGHNAVFSLGNNAWIVPTSIRLTE